MANKSSEASKLITTILRMTEEKIIPLTQNGVSSGSKLFGAAILSRSDLTPITIATNNERISPLLHGEINCIQQFFLSDPSERPSPKDCIFFATHEPCSLCLSGITWAGFNEFYFLFTYEDSRDLFSIPYDIDILQEVFRVPTSTDTAESLAARPLYNRKNKFFEARSLGEVLGDVVDEAEKKKLRDEIERIRRMYDSLSSTYQHGKEAGTLSESVWK